GGAVSAIALQPDGKLVIGGSFSEVGLGNARYGIARLNGDGSLDTNYNVSIPRANGCIQVICLASGFGEFSTPLALALLSDGKVLVGGNLNPLNGKVSDRVSVA